uniref:Uncharacterized protein n=1 Tax=Octopus bimaculoides TaxID=37653 RepID=A0A0L8G5N6_OCTBM
MHTLHMFNLQDIMNIEINFLRGHVLAASIIFMTKDQIVVICRIPTQHHPQHHQHHHHHHFHVPNSKNP